MRLSRHTSVEGSCAIRVGRNPPCHIEDRGECQSADQLNPHEARCTDTPGNGNAIPTAAVVVDQDKHELTAEAAY
jgi:hypothetical protein